MATESVLKTFRSKIAGCFGMDDGIFAGHPFDEKRAKELRAFAKKII